jgi:hypothetical protein
VLAFRFKPFEFTKAALGIHQSAPHLLELGDFLRKDLASARIDLATAQGHLGRKLMHFGTNQAQFHVRLRHVRRLLLRKVCPALRPQAALRVNLVAGVACRFSLEHDAQDLVILAPIATCRRHQ